MKPKQYSSEGVILARRDFSEADRIITVYSKNYGKLSLIAKGVKKPESKKRGSLEIFSQIKFSGINGKGLDILTEAENITSFEEIRKDLKKISLAYYLVEVVGKITHDEEKNLELYNLLVSTLGLISESNSLKTLRKNFIYELLVLTGYWVEGRQMLNPDFELEEVIERKLSSVRVGKRVLSG